MMENNEWRKPFFIVFATSFFLVAIGVDLLYYSPKPQILDEVAHEQALFKAGDKNSDDINIKTLSNEVSHNIPVIESDSETLSSQIAEKDSDLTILISPEVDKETYGKSTDILLGGDTNSVPNVEVKVGAMAAKTPIDGKDDGMEATKTLTVEIDSNPASPATKLGNFKTSGTVIEENDVKSPDLPTDDNIKQDKIKSESKASKIPIAGNVKTSHVTDNSKTLVISPPNVGDTGSVDSDIRNTKKNDKSKVDAKNINWCKTLDSDFTSQKIHFYYKGNTKTLVSIGTLLTQTNCLLCREVCQHLQQKVKDSKDQIWKKTMLIKLSGIVQKQIELSQKPTNCLTAKKLLCQTNSDIHEMAYCLLMAFITKRKLVTYNGKKSSDVFVSLNACSRDDITDVTHLGNVNEILKSTRTTITVPQRMAWSYPSPDFVFLAIPDDLAFSLMVLNDEPPSWWIAQFVKYCYKLRPEIESILQEETRPVLHEYTAGMYVRNKGKMRAEGRHPGFSGYMGKVIKYFDRIKKAYPRVVYLISDDPNGYDTLSRMYPDYTFLSKADTIHKEGIEIPQLVFNVYVLSHLDFVACTWSTEMCRTVYELIQGKGVNITQSFKSLDKMYIFTKNYQNWQVFQAVEEQISHHHSYLPIIPGDILERMFTNDHPEGHWCRVPETGVTGYVKRELVKRLWPLTRYPSFKGISTDGV